MSKRVFARSNCDTSCNDSFVDGFFDNELTLKSLRLRKGVLGRNMINKSVVREGLFIDDKSEGTFNIPLLLPGEKSADNPPTQKNLKFQLVTTLKAVYSGIQ